MFQKASNNPQERMNWLRLARSENVGPKTFKKLIELYGNATTSIEKAQELAANGGLKRKIKISSISEVENEIEKTIEYGAQIILSCDNNFPQKLKQIDDCPAAIIVKGSIEKLNKKKCVAIVGARNASVNGCSFAKELATDLGKAEVIIVSGLALGIDTYAHQGSINYCSIGVIAGGINNIYPPQNKKLFDDIILNGAIIAELPINTAPLAKHFPQRNRIISGISDAVVVVEAALKSGSLITADYSISQGKQVFAVPGTPTDARHKGTNMLIRNGAKITESAHDVMNFLNSISDFTLNEKIANYNAPNPLLPTENELSKYRKQFFEALSYSPTNLDTILEQTEIPLNVANLLILELELAGRLIRSFGNKICLLS